MRTIDASEAAAVNGGLIKEIIAAVKKIWSCIQNPDQIQCLPDPVLKDPFADGGV